MATNTNYTLSRNLRLRLDNNLTANSRYNLERLDLIGSSIAADTSDSTNVLSRANIVLEPESTKVGGSGIGGNVQVGSAGHIVDTVSVFARETNFASSIGVRDQSSSGSRYLRFRYASALSGSVDTAADRTLSFDLDGDDRSLILGGDLTVTGGDLVLVLSGDTNIQFPTSGTLSTLAGTETLINKTIDANLNTILNILPTQTGQAGKVLSTDGTTTSWITVAGSNSVQSAATNWNTSDGNIKVFTHGLGTTDIDVTIVDANTSEVIQVSSITRTDLNTIVLTSSEAPATSWRIIVQA